jgi:hypothetical protein
MVEADARWGQDRHGHDTTRWTGGAEAGWVLEAEAGKGKGKDDDNDGDDSNDSNDSGFVGRRARGRGFLSFKGAGRRGQAQGRFTGRNAR